jgi:hypothetical protein
MHALSESPMGFVVFLWQVLEHLLKSDQLNVSGHGVLGWDGIT